MHIDVVHGVYKFSMCITVFVAACTQSVFTTALYVTVQVRSGQSSGLTGYFVHPQFSVANHDNLGSICCNSMVIYFVKSTK